MIFWKKQLLLALTVLLLVILTFTTGHEGHRKAGQKLVSDGNNNTQKVENGNRSNVGNSSSDDYVWSNNDDYLNDDYANDEPMPDENDVTPKPKDASKPILNKSEAKDPSPTNTSLNDTVLESGESSENNSTTSESNPVSVQQGPDIPKFNNSESSAESDVEPSSDLSLTTSAEEISSTSSPENDTITSSENASPPPASISTQDVGGDPNPTTVYKNLVDDGLDPAGLRAWAVVIFSVLISFAVIFTILYIIRREIIRRRKADQRRLLRGSVSSEGYFYGDGEGSMGGKFEL